MFWITVIKIEVTPSEALDMRHVVCLVSTAHRIVTNIKVRAAVYRNTICNNVMFMRKKKKSTREKIFFFVWPEFETFALILLVKMKKKKSPHSQTFPRKWKSTAISFSFDLNRILFWMLFKYSAIHREQKKIRIEWKLWTSNHLKCVIGFYVWQ